MAESEGSSIPIAPPSRAALARAVFVDRDGTLNPDLHYLADPERVELFAGVSDGIRWFHSHEFRVVCVTNQSGIERGLYTDADVAGVHRRINERLAQAGTTIDAFYYCPHAPERGCACRKPGTLLFERARDELRLDLAASAIIGDRLLDVEVGHRLGMLTALVPERGREVDPVDEIDRSGTVPEIWAESFTGAAARVLARG
jgi:D-glycero-D-manno-heptose 1,7-bisphosphate phosphatase